MSNAWRTMRFKRDHRWTPRRMSDYLDGELAAPGRSRLERHVGECEECGGVLGGLRRTLAKLHGISAPAERPDPHRVAADVQERLSQHPET